MRKNSYAKKLSFKLKQIRQANNMSISDMANRLNLHWASYDRNENEHSIPGIYTLCALGSNFDISLDWFVLDKGPMYYMEKSESKTSAKDTAGSLSFTEDVKELLEHMGKIPLLRFEVLSQFYRFKEEHKELVERAMNPTPAVATAVVVPTAAEKIDKE